MGITKSITRRFLMACAVWGVCNSVSGQATLQALDVRAVAEVEVKSTQDGREVTTLAPANLVVPGDAVIYTLEIRNPGNTDIIAPVVTRAVPDHMVFVADSATGPGAEVSYSADGGAHFDRAENLRITGTDGRSRRAAASDYTHIRWSLRMTLKSKSVAYARFRAVVR